MEGQDEIDNYDASFIEQPAVLDKHKAAAGIVDGKFIAFNIGSFAGCF